MLTHGGWFFETPVRCLLCLLAFRMELLFLAPATHLFIGLLCGEQYSFDKVIASQGGDWRKARYEKASGNCLG